ncbi:MnhB domain-containing protein [Nesterenkonia alba]|uniref:MnhB domain-containing protein n=1 Tax=Nesterenkonia alba TaxID=515814 RepID=UPI0003B48A76|nr:MnhB domain-containing protein [Nesterenkonia alba]
MTEAGLLDGLLAAAVLAAVAVAVLPRARTAQSFGFLLLGVVVTLVWLRLGSVDVALAEAALGGGLLGAVLVYLTASSPTAGQPPSAAAYRWVRAVVGIICGVVVAVVVGAVWLRVEATMPAWEEPVAAQMDATGVEHGITGVLLAFRAYDTLLESAVLLFAAATALLLRQHRPRPAALPVRSWGPSLQWTARITAPVLLMTGLWLLFAGSTDSGGAFQSGAVLCAMLIVLHAGGVDLSGVHRWLRPLLVAGVLVFILAGVIGPVLGEPWLSWQPEWAFAAVLGIEVLLTAGIAVGLYAVFLGMLPEDLPSSQTPQEVSR